MHHGAGADPELDFEWLSYSFYCLFHVRGFLTQFALGDIANWRGHVPSPLGSTPTMVVEKEIRGIEGNGVTQKEWSL